MYYYVLKLLGVLKFLLGYEDDSAQSDVSLMYCVLKSFTSPFRTCQVVCVESWVCVEEPTVSTISPFPKQKKYAFTLFFLVIFSLSAALTEQDREQYYDFTALSSLCGQDDEQTMYFCLLELLIWSLRIMFNQWITQ